VKLINNQITQGIGRAFFKGVSEAKNDVVVMFPGDNENDPSDLMPFLKLMENVDIVVPFIHNVEIRNRFRRLVSAIYRFIVNISFGLNLNYSNGTVLYRRSILEDIELISDGFFYQAELLIKLIRKGYMFAEVPCLLSKRFSGKSKALTLKSLIRVIRAFLKVFFEIHILRLEGRRKDYRVLNANSATYRRILQEKYA